MSIREYKLVVLGISGVGKSALTIQFAHSFFVEDYDPTIDDLFRRQVNIDQEEGILDVLDTTSEFPTNYYGYLQGDGYLLVYSITERFTFEYIPKVYEFISHIKDGENVPMLLVGNKSDLEYERVVSYGQGEGLAKSLGIKFIETSAKNRVNVDEAFYELVREIRRFPTPDIKHRSHRKCCLL